jgi:hypothetical protein
MTQSSNRFIDEHKEFVSRLLKRHESLGIKLCQDTYAEEIFGSWILVIGIKLKRLKFSWDAKESYLGVGYKNFYIFGFPTSWEILPTDVGGTQVSQAEIFAFIDNVITEKFY